MLIEETELKQNQQEYHHQYYLENKDKYRQWYLNTKDKNKEKRRIRCYNYYLKNKEKVNESNRQFHIRDYKENREKYLKRGKENYYKYYEKIKQYYKARRLTKLRPIAEAKKAFFVELKGGKCSKCNGVFALCSYDFHHLNPASKEKKLDWINLNDEELRQEIDKCILLCANCHRLEHYNNRYK